MSAKVPVRMWLVGVAGLLAAGTVFGSLAELDPHPGGQDLPGEFSDGNGFLTADRPVDNPTWAKTHAKLSGINPALTKEASGGAIDNKINAGIIHEAVVPLWQWQLKAGMHVKSKGVDNAIPELVGEGKAALIHQVKGGATQVLGIARRTSDQHPAGDYDIDIDVTGFDGTVQTHMIQNGGESTLPGWAGGAGGWLTGEIKIDNQQWAHGGYTVEFKYESQALSYVKLEFTAPSTNSLVEVKVEHYLNNADQDPAEWAGVALAWDMNPYYGPQLLQSFLLE